MKRQCLCTSVSYTVIQKADMFLGPNFNLRYLQRLARDSRIPLLTALNSPSPRPHFCWTRLSSKQSFAGSSGLLDCPLIFLPVSVLEAISSSVKVPLLTPCPLELVLKFWNSSISAEVCRQQLQSWWPEHHTTSR